MVYMAWDWLLWIGIVFIGIGVLKFLFRLFIKKKDKQQLDPRQELLQKQTQGKLKRDAKAVDKIEKNLENTKDKRKRKELLKEADKVAKDEQAVAERGA